MQKHTRLKISFHCPFNYESHRNIYAYTCDHGNYICRDLASNGGPECKNKKDDVKVKVEGGASVAKISIIAVADGTVTTRLSGENSQTWDNLQAGY